MATGASSKTRYPGPQNLSNTQPALTRSSAKAGQAVKEVVPLLIRALGKYTLTAGPALALDRVGAGRVLLRF